MLRNIGNFIFVAVCIIAIISGGVIFNSASNSQGIGIVFIVAGVILLILFFISEIFRARSGN